MSTFVIPETVLAETLDALVAAGKHGNEAFVVWGGTVDGNTLTFSSAIVPEQTPHRTADGLLVTVAGEALFEINKTLYQRGELLGGQVHSHPTHAFHSSTDDCFSLVTMTGALSLVVPDFAIDGVAGTDRWAWYRLAGPGAWNELGSGDTITIAGREA